VRLLNALESALVVVTGYLAVVEDTVTVDAGDMLTVECLLVMVTEVEPVALGPVVVRGAVRRLEPVPEIDLTRLGPPIVRVEVRGGLEAGLRDGIPRVDGVPGKYRSLRRRARGRGV
jgi:hypothetical protein